MLWHFEKEKKRNASFLVSCIFISILEQKVIVHISSQQHQILRTIALCPSPFLGAEKLQTHQISSQCPVVLSQSICPGNRHCAARGNFLTGTKKKTATLQKEQSREDLAKITGIKSRFAKKKSK